MKDSRLSNRNPKCTILESFDGMIMVVGPNIAKSNHKEMKEAFDFIEKSYWEINPVVALNSPLEIMKPLTTEG
ncbi:MAG: hypothetical protein Q7V12_07510 [Deltaproteobacteria bacterium]|nr:hypothetical protein [Deltaproteobacteria bacterium]